MKMNCIPSPAYYIAVAFVIVVIVIVATVFQGCAVYGLSYVHGRPVEARGGYTSREAYLAGYEPYPVIVTGGYYPPYYFEAAITMPGSLVEGKDVIHYSNGTRPVLTVLANQTGNTLALDLYYDADGGLRPIAMKDGKPWNRIILGPRERKSYYLLEGRLTYNVYRLGQGENCDRPVAVRTHNVNVSYYFMNWGYEDSISIFDFN